MAFNACHFQIFEYHNDPKFSDRHRQRSGQTEQTEIRLLLEDQGLHCLPFRLHRLDQGYRNFEIQIGPLDR